MFLREFRTVRHGAQTRETNYCMTFRLGEHKKEEHTQDPPIDGFMLGCLTKKLVVEMPGRL
jgi:hypothetical protein